AKGAGKHAAAEAADDDDGPKVEDGGDAPKADDDDDDGPKKGGKGEAKKEKGDEPNELDRLIDQYEKRFERSGYDRIYIREGDKLFVALNASGSLPDVRPFYRVTMHHDNHLAASGQVLRVVDTPNSLKEATVGFWREVVGKTMSAIRGALTK